MRSLFFVVFGWVTGCAHTMNLPPPSEAEAIVVLGNRPPVDERGQVRPELRARVEAGVQAYRRGLAPLMVMTGGPAPSGHVEAEVMKALAVELGVPASAIRVEGRSRDTIANARFTVELLCDGRPEPCRPSVIVVSTRHHLERAQRLFECAGARVQLVPSALEVTGAHRMREGFVRLYYGFVDSCERARTAHSPEPTP